MSDAEGGAARLGKQDPKQHTGLLATGGGGSRLCRGAGVKGSRALAPSASHFLISNKQTARHATEI